MLAPVPVCETAQRPAEWIQRATCSEWEWSLFQRARERFEATKQRMQSAQVDVRPVPGLLEQPCAKPSQGQSTLHSYGGGRWDAPPDPDSPRFIPTNRQTCEHMAPGATHTCCQCHL